MYNDPRFNPALVAEAAAERAATGARQAQSAQQ
jgi:hypothetical protein